MNLPDRTTVCPQEQQRRRYQDVRYLRQLFGSNATPRRIATTSWGVLPSHTIQGPYRISCILNVASRVIKHTTPVLLLERSTRPGSNVQSNESGIGNFEEGLSILRMVRFQDDQRMLSQSAEYPPYDSIRRRG